MAKVVKQYRYGMTRSIALTELPKNGFVGIESDPDGLYKSILVYKRRLCIQELKKFGFEYLWRESI